MIWASDDSLNNQPVLVLTVLFLFEYILRVVSQRHSCSWNLWNDPLFPPSQTLPFWPVDSLLLTRPAYSLQVGCLLKKQHALGSKTSPWWLDEELQAWVELRQDRSQYCNFSVQHSKTVSACHESLVWIWFKGHCTFRKCSFTFLDQFVFSCFFCICQKPFKSRLSKKQWTKCGITCGTHTTATRNGKKYIQAISFLKF